MKGRLNYRRIKNEIYDKDNWFWYKLDSDYYFPEYYLGKRLSIEKATRVKEQKIKEDAENNTECCKNIILGKYGREQGHKLY